MGKGLPGRSLAGGFLRSIKISEGSRTAAKEFPPTFGQGLPCVSDPALQPVTPFFEVRHHRSSQMGEIFVPGEKGADALARDRATGLIVHVAHSAGAVASR